jgi:SAM-dependent methyltransferase
LNRTQKRLGKKGKNVKYIVADVGNFVPPQQYDFGYDRATFHFLTTEIDISHYVQNVQQYLRPNGYFLVGTFAEEGPIKCSDLDTKQYAETSLSNLFSQFLYKIKCLNFEHLTLCRNLFFVIFRSQLRYNRFQKFMSGKYW